ncbi:MAG: preprotein translocase subunit SecE [Acidobacteriaceae bacterium]|jgi:preprotein translocase subunit SecE
MAKTIAVADQQTTGLERLKSRPQELKEFLQNVRAEMRKVVTPTRTEVQSTTTVVIVTVFIFAAYFFVVDSVLGQAVTRLIHYLTTR